MNRYLNIITKAGTLIIIIIFLVQCKDDNPTEEHGNDQSLIGDWELTEVYVHVMDQTLYPVDLGFETVIKFNENGKFEIAITENEMTETETGTWTTANGAITMVKDGENQTLQYSVDGNTGRIYNWPMEFEGAEVNADITFVKIVP